VCRPKQFFRALFLSVAMLSLVTASAFADSQVRIVRLSDVEGDVKVDRNAGQGMEKAFLNLPLIQGAKIATGKSGRAEVEFEDGSTLRLAPETNITFSQLSLRDSGAKVSTLHLEKGTAYLNFVGTKTDEFALSFGRESLALKNAAHVRVVTGDTDSTVAVFRGDAGVTGASGSFEVSKSHTANFDLMNKDKYTLAREVDPEPYDDWDQEQDQYHERYRSSHSALASTSGYGASDLDYYGAFSNVPGYGSLWQPYLAGAGWDPFMSGVWAFYPGAGYVWASGYPWGWTPYYSGSWLFVPGYGWGWQSGGNWYGWPIISVTNPPAGFQLPQPPASGHGIITITCGPMPSRLNQSGSKLSIPRNSAGLGIPRGSIRNFGDLSQAVQKAGVINAHLHMEPVGEAADFWPGQLRMGGSPFHGPSVQGDASAPRVAASSPASSGGSAGRPK
jgi:FecR protein